MPKCMLPLDDTLMERRWRLGRQWYWPRGKVTNGRTLEVHHFLLDPLRVDAVKIKCVWIGKRKARAIQELTEEYLKRISRYVQVVGIAIRDEAALLEMCGHSTSAKGG